MGNCASANGAESLRHMGRIGQERSPARAGGTACGWEGEPIVQPQQGDFPGPPALGGGGGETLANVAPPW